MYRQLQQFETDHVVLRQQQLTTRAHSGEFHRVYLGLPKIRAINILSPFSPGAAENVSYVASLHIYNSPCLMVCVVSPAWWSPWQLASL